MRNAFFGILVIISRSWRFVLGQHRSGVPGLQHNRVLYYVDPMHPRTSPINRASPGLRMQLEPVYAERRCKLQLPARRARPGVPHRPERQQVDRNSCCHGGEDIRTRTRRIPAESLRMKTTFIASTPPQGSSEKQRRPLAVQLRRASS